MSTTDFERLLAVRKGKTTTCQACGQAQMFSLIFTWQTHSQGVKNGCSLCYVKLTGRNKSVAHQEFEIAAKKRAEGTKLTHWDKRIIGAYEAWCEGRAEYTFVLEVATDIRKEKDKWKNSKGY